MITIVPKLSEGQPIIDNTYWFGLMMTFFELLGKALAKLEDHLRIEPLAGDMLGVMAKMRSNSDTLRPADYPRQYTRAWLSNVP